MKIRERIEFKSKPPVLTFSPKDTVIKAVRAMSEKNYGASIIVDSQNKPIGIVSERDFMRRVLNKGLDANTTTLDEVMTTNLRLAKEDDEVLDWLQVMSNERFRHLPVVDEQGCLLNLMSQGDFVSYTWPQLLNQMKETVTRSFMEKYSLYLILGAVMLYSAIMVVIIRKM